MYNNMLRGVLLENEKNQDSAQIFLDPKFRVPFTLSQLPSHDENLILCGIMRPKIVNAKNRHFACSSLKH